MTEGRDLIGPRLTIDEVECEACAGVDGARDSDRDRSCTLGHVLDEREDHGRVLHKVGEVDREGRRVGVDRAVLHGDGGTLRDGRVCGRGEDLVGGDAGDEGREGREELHYGDVG